MLEYGTVVGKFLSIIEDSSVDLDNKPDTEPASGTITFSPDIPSLRVEDLEGKSTTCFPQGITVSLDSNGEITHEGVLGIPLLSTSNENTTPLSWTYTVDFDLESADGRRLNLPRFSLEVPANEITDLSVATPVPASKGIPVLKGKDGVGVIDVTVSGNTITFVMSDGMVNSFNLTDLINTTGSGFEVNITDFGAVGDGVTDNTVAIQSAIDSIESVGGSVIIPEGTYVISDTLNLFNAISLRGENSSSSVIYQTNESADGIAGVDILHFSMKGLRLSGPTTGTGTGLSLTRVSNESTNYVHMEDVRIRTFGARGLYISNPIVSSFNGVVCESNGTDGFMLQGENNIVGTSCTLSNIYGNANGQRGIVIDTMAYTTLNACAAENSPVTFDIINSLGVTLNGCGSERSFETAFRISGGFSCTFNGGWVNRSGGIGIDVAGNVIGLSLIGIAETSPEATATAFLRTLAGAKVAMFNVHNTVPNDLAYGTTQIFNDVAGNSSFNGDLNVAGDFRSYGSAQIDGALNVTGNFTVNGQPVSGGGGTQDIRGSRWWVSGAEYNANTDIPTGSLVAGDIFLYDTSKDLYQWTGSQWNYAGVLGG